MLKDYYEIIEYDIKPRPVVLENIEKVVNCGDPSYGGAMYGCPHCGNLKFVPFRCHSKFCPTCGAKYSNDRSTAMSFKLINCTHRHLVFTIDESLRHFFLKTVTCSTASLRLFPMLSRNSFSPWTNLKILFPDLFVSFIPLDVLLSGIRTSIASSLKAGIPMTDSGVLLNISIILTSVNHFRLSC